MKTFKLFLLLFLLSESLVSCTQVKQLGCAVEVLVVHSASPVIATALQCANEPAIESDLMHLVDKTGLCAKAPDPNATVVEGKKAAQISPALCQVASDAIVGFASTAVPTNWQCGLTAAGATLGSLIQTACLAIPL